MAEDYKDAAKRFRNDTAKHEMTVLHNDGLYRHLRFRRPERGCYWFDLITVPGALIFQGDGETFAFRRIEDMFQFFRGPVGSINPHYWAEKLTSDRDNVMTYDETLFTQQVAEALKEAEEDYPGVTDAWNAKGDGVLPEYYTGTEDEARAALDAFEFGASVKASCTCGAVAEFPDEVDAAMWRSRHIPAASREAHRSSVEHVEGFRFYDTGEWRLRDYDWWFLWACHALVWGIAQYDATQVTQEGGRTRRFLRDLLRAMARQS